MATEVQRRKLERRFEMMDTNGDGYLEREDLEALGLRLVAGFGESRDSAKGRPVVDGYIQLWDAFLRQADGDGDGRLTRDEFVGLVENQIIDGDGFDAVYLARTRAIVDMCDGNGDGRLDQTEFMRLTQLLGATDEEAAESFQRIDGDGDGYLTVDELVAAARDFYMSSDPESAGTLLYGRV